MRRILNYIMIAVSALGQKFTNFAFGIQNDNGMINYVSGDILHSVDEYIAQGVAVGSQEGLGTGLAYKLSSKFPEIQKLFKKHTRNRKFGAGDIFVGKVESEFPGIIYIATQPDMYHAELSYLNKGLKRLKKLCGDRDIKTVSMPKIGAGLGKLDWHGGDCRFSCRFRNADTRKDKASVVTESTDGIPKF